MALLQFTEKGIFCERANVYIDPWKPVDYAIITHAHADHSRWGNKFYLSHHLSKPIIQHRLGSDILIESMEYLEKEPSMGFPLVSILPVILLVLLKYGSNTRAKFG